MAIKLYTNPGQTMVWKSQKTNTNAKSNKKWNYVKFLIKPKQQIKARWTLPHTHTNERRQTIKQKQSGNTQEAARGKPIKNCCGHTRGMRNVAGHKTFLVVGLRSI